MRSSHYDLKWSMGIVLGAWIIGLLVYGVIKLTGNPQRSPLTFKPVKVSLLPFVDADDFTSYIHNSEAERNESRVQEGFANQKGLVESPALPTVGTADTANRIIGTNVQVAGIDEPDIVKTDGEQIYVSKQNPFFPVLYNNNAPDGISFEMQQRIMPIDTIMPPPQKNSIGIIDALPVAELKEKASIEAEGEMLLSKGMLLVFSNGAIYGFDVTHLDEPVKSWEMTLEPGTYVNTARLYQEKVYVLLTRSVNYESPCPLQPLSLDGDKLTIPCSDIYHPTEPTSIDSTLTLLSIIPQTGEIDRSISFTGYSGNSLVYMSGPDIYFTYSTYGDSAELMSAYLGSTATEDIFPEKIRRKYSRLTDYELSESTKIAEINLITQDYLGSLKELQRREIWQRLEEKMAYFMKQNQRDLETTSIVKVNTKEMKISSIGAVPGHLLNQFSMDVYENNLRVATTISGNGWWGQGEPVNDIYILNEAMEKIGKVVDLGLSETIYSTRFMGNRGYVVTFRQTDPFYVIDLSNPTEPKVAGELKIPGYSGYLHPLSENLILGVGQEMGRLKVAIFDVKDAATPQETAKELLMDYGSEALTNHHAFTHDPLRSIFFLPSDTKGYIYSYDNGLKLVQEIDQPGLKRAIVLDNYLYLISTSGITVYNETDWSEVNHLEW